MLVEERKHHLFGKFFSHLSALDKDVKWQQVAAAVTPVLGFEDCGWSKKNWSTMASEAKKRGALLKTDQEKTGRAVRGEATDCP